MPASLWVQEATEKTGRNGNENHCNFKPKGRRGKNNNLSLIHISEVPQHHAVQDVGFADEIRHKGVVRFVVDILGLSLIHI